MPRKTLPKPDKMGPKTYASMRPRPDAAENSSATSATLRCYRSASMRPRPDAAENLSGNCPHFSYAKASMRPRPDAAENPPAPAETPIRYECFNEAAARCRGKRTTSRPEAAPPNSFNEAAARCRGKRPRPDGPAGRTRRFNEAAARCRGKPRTPLSTRERGEPLQ